MGGKLNLNVYPGGNANEANIDGQGSDSGKRFHYSRKCYDQTYPNEADGGLSIQLEDTHAANRN